MDKQKFIEEKMRKLVGDEGYSRAQAYAIAISYWNRRQQGGEQEYAQMGYNIPDYNEIIKSQFLSPQQDFSVDNQNRLLNYYTPATFTKPSNMDWDLSAPDTTALQPKEELPQDYSWYEKENQKNNNVDTYYNNRVNILNPNIGTSLDYALNIAGRGFGAKNPWQAGIGTGLSLLKGARNFLTGFSEGKETARVIDEMQNEQFNRPKKYIWAQQGKEITNADVIAKNAITEQGFGNINMENGEFVLRNNGQVQPVIGEPHIKDGKTADGVNATLNTGDKVISDYVKLRPQDIKELKDRYNISLKKGATFAEAQKKIDSKLGITKLESEKADILKKYEDLQKQDDTITKQLNLSALEKIISNKNEKLNILSGVRAESADFIFNLQEQIPKKPQDKLYDDNGKEIAQQGCKKKAQQGGTYLEDLAKKHNIPLERAMQLINMQQGGVQSEYEENEEGRMSNSQEEVGEIPPEQIIQMFAELTKQDPKVVLQQLQNLKPEEQQQALEQMAQVLQQGQQNSQGENTEYAQQGGFSFSTRYTPTIAGYQVDGLSVLNQDTLSDVEEVQPYTGKGYGAKMANVDETMKVHSWYFDTEEKKKAFKEAVLKEGRQPEVEAFQKAYNEELRSRAKKAGVPEKEIENVINQVGFSDKGVQKFDGLFGAFTSTRPLFDFKKSEGEIKIEVKEQPTTLPDFPEQKQVEIKDRIKNVVPNFEPYIPFFTPIQPIAKQNVFSDRVSPIKMTAEPMLAEQERQRQADVVRVEQTGMSPQQQEAVLAQSLASSQMASNDAISRVEGFNAQSQQQADNTNLNLGLKEQIMNNQFNLDYQDKMMASIANQEDTIRNIYREQFLQGQSDRNYINNLNKLNTLSDNFALTPNGVEYLNNKPPQYNNNEKDLIEWLRTASPEKRDAWMKMFNKKFS